VRAACTEHLITRYTSAVGVLLQANPMDPYAVSARLHTHNHQLLLDMFGLRGQCTDYTASHPILQIKPLLHNRWPCRILVHVPMCTR
jgi:hypothetical protein